MTAAVFWASAALIAYGTVGYPLLIWLRARWAPRPVRQGDITPRVTLIVAARNESHTIGRRLANLQGLDYPRDLVDIVVVSDGSTDGTSDVVEAIARETGGRLRLIDLGAARGKAVALNAGLAAARGEIVVYADARQTFDRGALRALVRNFADPEVGAVSGELVLDERDGAASAAGGLGVYWRLEKMLRRAESRSGSTIGCTGAIYAVRRRLISPLPEGTILDDVLTPMRVLLGGHRVVFEPHARAVDRLAASLEQEFARKVRTIAGNVQIVRLCPELLNPFGGTAVWRFVSHKLLPRVLMPYCLVAFLLASAALPGILPRLAFVAQIALYGGGVIGLMAPGRAGRACDIASSFLVLNAASIVAVVRYAAGRRTDLWRHAARSTVPPGLPGSTTC